MSAATLAEPQLGTGPMTSDERDALRHAVGADRMIKGTRNWYSCDRYTRHILELLVKRGYARRGHTSRSSGDTTYHLTEAGCRAAGLNDGETLRALRCDPESDRIPTLIVSGERVVAPAIGGREVGR